MNAFKTAALLGLMTAIILVIGNVVGGRQGMIYAFIIAGIMNFVSYWFSDRIVLAMYRAKPIEREQVPELYEILHNLTMKAGMPMPKLYMIPTDAPNAFATGRDPEHAVVAVTEGILRLLNREELEGVLSHELSHVTNRDILISSVAATLAGAIMLIARIAQFGLIFGGYGGGRRDDRGGKSHRVAFDDHCCADCSDADSARNFQVARVWRRRKRSEDYRQRPWIGKRPAEAASGFSTPAHARRSGYGPPVHHQTVLRPGPDFTVQHASTD